ncbi:MAG: hypothetical protein QOI76_321 [Frankiales bacterium]|nr:hypothetical protein [Frankiales bacterium]
MPHDGRSDDGHAGGGGFTAFADSDRRTEQRKRRRSVAGKAVAGVLVLGAVGGVAAVTSGGHGKAAPTVAATGPTVGEATKPLPPQVVFVTAKLGYALAVYCDSQPVGEGCLPTLSRTTDGAASWTPVKLPAGTPVDPTHSYGLMARGHDVLLAWTTAAFVSTNDGDGWQPVTVDLAGTTTDVPSGAFLIGSESRLLVVDPDKATALTFRPPQKVELPGGSGGKLSDQSLWMRDSASIGISSDNGVHWNINPVPNAEVAAAPLLGAPRFLALLTGPANGSTIGVPGAGGELPASTAFFSTNAGDTWDPPTALGGPKVNAVCTVYLDDQSLLGVATDGKSLLSLPKGESVFVPATDAPGVTPYCLLSHGSLVWGATADNRVVLKTDTAKGWAIHALPTQRYGVAVPSPSPSAAK